MQHGIYAKMLYIRASNGAFHDSTTIMSNVVNLNKARKLKARKDAEQQAAENRIKFGRTKAQKQLNDAESAAAKIKLDHLKRETPTQD